MQSQKKREAYERFLKTHPDYNRNYRLANLDREKKRKEKFLLNHPNYYHDYRVNNADYVHNYLKNYRKDYNLKHRKELNAKSKKYNEKYPEKVKAHAIAHKFSVKGKHCAYCGSTINLEKHHPDYSKPDIIIIACKTCHEKLKFGPLKFWGESLEVIKIDSTKNIKEGEYCREENKISFG